MGGGRRWRSLSEDRSYMTYMTYRTYFLEARVS